MLAIINSGFHPKVSHAQPIAVRSRPAAVEPRPHYEHVKYSRVLLFDTLISSQCAEQIFVVVPAPNRHHRRVNVLEIRKDVSLFPKLVIVRMRHHLVPELEAKAELL